MTRLKEFYESLPMSTAPKTNFVREMSYVCGVSEATVRNWISGRAKPTQADHIDYLSKATGIPKESLFKEQGV